jgi:hypothetical protein
MKRFVFAFIAAFIFIVLWGWFFNGMLLKDVSAEVQSLFRPREEIMSLFHWIIIGQAGLALSFVMIYASGFAGGGIAAGVRLGIMLEILGIGDLRDATIPGKAARADKHRRLHRDDCDWRHSRCDLQVGS